MKLKDFITTVLVDIEQGVNNAAGLTNRRTFLHTFSTKEQGGVEFDVALTAGKVASGKIGAEVFSVGAKTEGKISNEQVSRVRFRINVGDYFKR